MRRVSQASSVVVAGLALVALVLPGCATMQTGDAYLAAEECVRAGRLLRALALLDRVPPAHPHYAEARTLAQAVERRIRVSQDLISKGLALRSEWRDEEALELFRSAAAVWPGAGGPQELIDATQNRIHALEHTGSGGGVPQARTRVVTTPDIASVGPDAQGGEHGQVPSAPLVEVQRMAGAEGYANPDTGAAAGTRAATAQATGAEAAAALAEQARRLRLRDAQQCLERGEMTRAMEILEELAEEAPHDAQLLATLVRVLHQRALLRYGQGWLELAIADWSRVLELRAGDRHATDFAAAARAELAERKTR